MARKQAPFGLPAARELLAIVTARTAEYGGFTFDAATTVALCKQLFGVDVTAADLGKLLMSMKLGRVAHGTMTRDSLLDVAGYACILADMLRPHTKGTGDGT